MLMVLANGKLVKTVLRQGIGTGIHDAEGLRFNLRHLQLKGQITGDIKHLYTRP